MSAHALRLASLATAVAVLAGCASTQSLDSEVNSYSQWPESRRPTTFSFERLPSQQANAQEQAALEAAARPALTGAGFAEATGGSADVSVQVGLRSTRQQRSGWDDPFLWHGGFGYGRGRGGWLWGPSVSLNYTTPRYDQEVQVLIRDARSGQALYETRASHESYAQPDTAVLQAMFDAALKDFPRQALNPRRVVVPLAAAAPASAASTARP